MIAFDACAFIDLRYAAGLLPLGQAMAHWGTSAYLRCLVWLAALVTVSIAGWGCGEAPTPSLETGNQQTGTSDGRPAATSAPADDRDESLTSAEYIRLGMPAHDRDWAGNDMMEVQKILTALAEQGFRKLPRYQSERSGDVFARITSAQNLEILQNRTLPLDARFPNALNHFQANAQLMKLYLTGFLRQEVRDSELIELIGSQLRLTVVVLDLTDEFLPRIDRNDQARMRGLEQMKRGMANVVAGSLTTLTETELYRESERARLVGYMQDAFPQIVPRLQPASRDETLVRLRKMQEDDALKPLRPGLRELLGKVEAAVARGG